MGASRKVDNRHVECHCGEIYDLTTVQVEQTLPGGVRVYLTPCCHRRTTWVGEMRP